MDKFCPKCGTERKEGFNYCGKCYYVFRDEQGKPYKSNWRGELNLWANVFLWLGVVVFAIWFILNNLK
jgi:rubredoxin